jgi:hypothetical protein
MPDSPKDGIIFIRDGTILPPILSVTTDAFMPNCRIVTSHNRSTLARSIEECDWYFFYLAGDIQVTVLGGNTRRVLRKALKVILAKHGNDQLNSIEITSIASRRILGVPFTTFTSHSRQIQQRIALIPEAKVDSSVPATPVAGGPSTKLQPVLASRS